MSDFEVNGNAAHGYTVKTDWGSVRLASGAVEIELGRIRSVGLSNVCEVESHHINRVAGSTSHVVRFIGGSCLQFAYNDRGEFIELSCGPATVAIDESGTRLTIGALPHAPSSTV